MHLLPGLVHTACHRSHGILKESAGRYLPKICMTSLEITIWIQVGAMAISKVIADVFIVKSK